MGHCLMMRKGEVHTAPVTGVLASSLAVGSTVKLMEGGTAVEYLVVNQGIPSNSNLYDASCDGTWLLRKDCHSKRKWDTRAVNAYNNSAINTWLNGDFFNSLGSVEQSVIKQVKIPYGIGGPTATVNSGPNGLSVKCFLLSAYEVGWTTSDMAFFPVDGAKLNYFTASSAGNSMRIAYLNGSTTLWFIRSPRTDSSNLVFEVSVSGSYHNDYASESYGIRPALILPKTALFDKTTMLLKGVK